MNKKIAPKDNSANIGNANKGTPGTKQLAGTPDATPVVKSQDATKGPGRGG